VTPAAAARPWRIAQVNVAKLAAPLDHPSIDEFREALDHINQLGESQPGFVWRAKGAGFDATDCRVFDDPEILINATVWDSVEHLAAFAYRTEHRHFVRRRHAWFAPMDEAFQAIWWVPFDHIPDLDECVERLLHLRAHGPTAHAFDFKTRFPAPISAASSVEVSAS
jgi:heme-degrading monooxygenase HmoA